MEFMLPLILFLSFESSSLAENVNEKLKIDLESRDFEELKEYVAESMTQMAAKHAEDIQRLENLINTQGMEIETLKSDNLVYISSIRELKKEIEEMKGNNIKVKHDTDTERDYEKLNDESASNSDDEWKSKSAQNLDSSTLKESGDPQSRIRKSIAGTNVAFFASLTQSIEHLGKDQDIVFDHVVTNIGNAYNQHHGTIVAPVSGTYVFSVTLVHNGETTWGHFVVNGVVEAKLYISSSDFGASHTIVVHLSAGDDVSVQNTEADRGFLGDRYSTLCGFLLNEDNPVNKIVG